MYRQQKAQTLKYPSQIQICHAIVTFGPIFLLLVTIISFSYYLQCSLDPSSKLQPYDFLQPPLQYNIAGALLTERTVSQCSHFTVYLSSFFTKVCFCGFLPVLLVGHSFLPVLSVGHGFLSVLCNMIDTCYRTRLQSCWNKNVFMTLL